jgi:hypothetical protein
MQGNRATGKVTRVPSSPPLRGYSPSKGDDAERLKDYLKHMGGLISMSELDLSGR